MRRESYTIGVDLGKLSDPTAVSIIRRVEVDDGAGDASPATYEIPFLQRLPLGTTYPAVVTEVKRLLLRPDLRRAEICVDATGCGLPVADLFFAAGVSVIKVLITGGMAVSLADDGTWHVAKIHLISGLQSLLHDGRLKILKTLTEAPALMSELQDFRAEVSDSGAWRFGARSGQHDDLVLAASLAIWRAKSSEVFSGWLGFYGREARRARGELPPAKAMPLPVLEPPSAPAYVALHAPRPFDNFQPAAGIRYASDEAGLVNVDPAHVPAMLNLGCWEITTKEKVDADAQISTERKLLRPRPTLWSNA